MKRGIIFVLIVLLGFLLRFYQLGVNPPSLDWDEASLGYNAYSILKTGSDEYGKKFPIAIRSFNDFKPAGYVYWAVPAIAALGLSEWAIRLPSAVLGVLTVFATYFLVRTLLDGREKLSLLVTLFLAISPWHVHFSRIAFESNLALSFFVFGTLSLAIFLKRQSLAWLILSSACYAITLYSYHSARLVVPAFLASVSLFYSREFWLGWQKVVIAVVLGIILLLPLGISTIKEGSTQARFGSVSIFTSSGLNDVAKSSADLAKSYWQQDAKENDFAGRILHGRVATYGKIFLKNYLDHFNLAFLFLKGDNNLRHHAPDVGMLYFWELFSIILGIIFFLKWKNWGRGLILSWFLLAPIASALTSETPHAVRSLIYLPTWQIFSALGVLALLRWSKERKAYSLATVLVTFILAANVFYYVHQYFIHMPKEYAHAWQYGYPQMVERVKQFEASYDQVYVTVSYDQPYIYFLLFGKTDPSLKNTGLFSSGFGKYRFVNCGQITNEEKKRPSTLYVAAPGDSCQPARILEEIHYPDGQIAFTIGDNGILTQ